MIDGGGLVTLSGGGKHRILYQNTCDQRLVWTTSHCNDQATPKLVLRNLTFTRGNSTGSLEEGGGGGAVFVRGGRLSVVNSTFTRNRCDKTGPDLGGAAIRVLDQFRDQPVKVTGSTFTGGRCSNGAALSSIGVSWMVTDSVFRGNKAIGRGANPAGAGTPGGGSGGAIYLDGNLFTLRLVRTTIEGNVAREGGGAVFFVSNDRTGTLTIQDSTLHDNPSLGFENYPGIFFLGRGDAADQRLDRRPSALASALAGPAAGCTPHPDQGHHEREMSRAGRLALIVAAWVGPLVWLAFWAGMATSDGTVVSRPAAVLGEGRWDDSLVVLETYGGTPLQDGDEILQIEGAGVSEMVSGADAPSAVGATSCATRCGARSGSWT